MTRDDIIKLAREAGLHLATDVNWMPIIGLEYAEKFAALVLANNPPQSFMSWQEGYEAGRLAEREACANIDWTPILRNNGMVTWGDAETLADLVSAAIRARGKT